MGENVHIFWCRQMHVYWRGKTLVSRDWVFYPMDMTVPDIWFGLFLTFLRFIYLYIYIYIPNVFVFGRLGSVSCLSDDCRVSAELDEVSIRVSRLEKTSSQPQYIHSSLRLPASSQVDGLDLGDAVTTYLVKTAPLRIKVLAKGSPKNVYFLLFSLCSVKI